MATSGAASDNSFVKIMTFPLQYHAIIFKIRDTPTGLPVQKLTARRLISRKVVDTAAVLRINQLLIWQAGGRLNKKDGLTRYGDSHVKDKTS